MHLTFDDGLKECSTIIAPILNQKGIPATFFVSPNFIDNKAIFHRFKRSILESKGILRKGTKNYLVNEVEELDILARKNNIDFLSYQPYMSYDDLVKLNNNGFTIGAHSLNHPEMWTLTENEQLHQINESMQWVTKHFNPEIKAFSFPFTDYGISKTVFKKIEKNNNIDVTFGTAGLKFDDCFKNKQRIPIELKQNWSIKKVVHFEFLYSKLRNLFSINRIKR